MKKVYSKPLVAVESLAVNMPIALGCDANFDDVQSLVDLGYFGETDGRVPKCAEIYYDIEWGNDSVCYHSNVQTAFLS